MKNTVPIGTELIIEPIERVRTAWESHDAATFVPDSTALHGLAILLFGPTTFCVFVCRMSLTWIRIGGPRARLRTVLSACCRS